MSIGRRLVATSGGAISSSFGAGVPSGVSSQSLNLAITSPPERVAVTVYQNTGATARFVAVQASSASAQDMQAYSDANATPLQLVIAAAVAAGKNNSIGFWVLPGNYYQVTFGTTPADGDVLIWTEWS